MRWIVLIAALAGCKKEPCDQAVDHAFGMKDFASVLAFDAADMPAAKSGAKQSCKMTPWDPAATRCLANAGSTLELAHCMTMSSLDRWHTVQLEQLDPNGTKRYADVEPAIAQLREAVALVTPSDEPIPCAVKKPVIAFDLAAAQLLVQGKAPPEHAPYVAPPYANAIVAYAAKAKIWANDVGGLRDWATKLPKDAVWAFIDTKRRVEPAAHGAEDFTMGLYEAVMHVVDPVQKAEICRTYFTAESSDSVETVVGSDEKINGQVSKAMVERDFDKRITAAIDAQVKALQ